MNNLLYDEHPLIVNPTLATIIGLNEAIVLQQVHYWIEIEKKSKDREVIEKHYHDGKWWIYNTYDQWQKQFPFWTKRGIRGIINKLEKSKLLISGNYNKYGYDHTKWYTIDYKLLESLENSDVSQNDTSKCHESDYGYVTDVQTNTIDYPQTTTIDFIKCTMEQNSKNVCSVDFSYKVVENQIRKLCREYDGIDTEETVKIILYYCKKYEQVLSKYHPKMRNEHYRRIIDFLSEMEYGYDFEMFKVLIDDHFKINYGKPIDYNMNHFFTEGIIKNRQQETCM